MDDYYDSKPQLNVLKVLIGVALIMLVLSHPTFVEISGFDIFDISKDDSRVETVESKPLMSTLPMGYSLKKGYYYESLDEYDRVIYNALLDSMNGIASDEIVINEDFYPNPGAYHEMLYKMYRMVILDNPHIHSESDSLIYGMRSEAEEFRITEVGIKLQDGFENAIVDDYDAIMKEVELINNQVEGQSEYEKIRHFYSYLVDNVSYVKKDEKTRVHSPAGVFIDKEAVCEGIAESFKMLCDYADIPCITVVNDDHAWNVIYRNGEIYHLDATWDLGMSKWTYFMIPYDELLILDPLEHNLSEEIYGNIFRFFN